MKTNKLYYVLGSMLILSSLAFFGYASADNDKSNEDRGKSEQSKEAHMRGSTLEVHISDKGKVDVRGAKVTAISGNVITASTSWGVANLVWSVNVSSDTNIVRLYGGKSLVSEISVGDFVSFKGNLVTTSASPIIVNATMVKDWSIQVRNASFNGTVKSVDVPNSKFVFSFNKNGDITVTTSASTKFTKGEVAGVFADVIVGAKISTKGLYDSQLKQLNASEVKVKIPEVVSLNH
ncbi:MAG: hypothetical protein WC847_03050 [Candidatus Paceibacterota bacterium]|jgi:hypothetical protein